MHDSGGMVYSYPSERYNSTRMSSQLHQSPQNPRPQQPGLGPPAPQRPQPPSTRAILLWWVIMIVLTAWNVLTFWPRQPVKVNLPYNVFITQIESSNVKDVQIADDVIKGTFVKPIAWSPPPGEQNPQGAQREPAQQNPPANTPGGQQPNPQAESQNAKAQPPPTYKEFRVVFPKAIGDPTLLKLLEAHNVVINVEAPPTHWFLFLLSDGLPILLLLAFFLYIGRQAARSQAGIFSFGRSRARRYSSENPPKVTFADVAGDDEAKAELQEEVDFLRHPKKYHAIGARIPRGILLVGHPGTGKTLLARAVAGEAGVPFFHISGSEFVEMFVGVGASRVRDLFQQAKAAAPSIIFIDELDAVGRRRGAGVGQVNDEREQTLNQLLVEMDGFDERHEVIVMAATNRPDVLDPALLRPGRFDRQVEIGLPDREAREGILRIHTRPLRLADDVDLDTLARATMGLSGADLANLCNEAALIAARQNRLQVAMADFERALDKALLGEQRRALSDERERRIVAYHESGHAVVAWFTPEADPVHKVTIIPHGRALGVTAQLPTEDHQNYSRSYLLARLTVMLGGRSAEELIFGDITTGAENDLVEATRLARRMVTRWGMGTLGPVAFKSDGEHPFLGYELSQGRDYSEATADRIDREVQKVLDERHKAARQLLTQRHQELDRLVERLLVQETVSGAELTRIVGPRPEPREEQPALKELAPRPQPVT